MTTLLNSAAAAAWCGVRYGTLARWRQRGSGPPYLRLEGIVRYRTSDLDAWLESSRCVPVREPAPQSDDTEEPRRAA